jgi:5-carboxymethyl-2-hydroxymuconate isomerase
MPHLVIEYSSDGHGGRLDIGKLMQAVHDTAADNGLKAADTRVRAAAFSDYLVAGQKDGFCHVSVYMRGGRSPAQKIAVSEALCDMLAAMLPETKSVSVDIRDMDPIAYRKRHIE